MLGPTNFKMRELFYQNAQLNIYYAKYPISILKKNRETNHLFHLNDDTLK